MTARRTFGVLAALTVAAGLVVLVVGSLLLSPGDSGALAVVAGVAVLVAAVVAGSGGVMVVRYGLRPFRDLARAVAGQDPHTMTRFLNSDVPEIVAVAAAVQHTQAQLTTSMADLERDRSETAALFEHMADGVLVLDADARIELANPATCRLLGEAQLCGRALATAVRDPDVVELIRAARERGLVRHPVELRGPNERRTCLQVVATQLPFARRVLVVLHDITELRRAEVVRRDFVANVSHELRTPVATLKALVETLEAGGLEDPEGGPDFLRRMHIEVDGLAQLVTELLELARIEAGRLDLDLQTCRAEQLICAAVERIRPYAARVGLTVDTTHLDSDLFVDADPRQVGQVLGNLLANAVKFTPRGGHIEVGARRDHPFVELWVADSGVGINGHDLIRVFERFYKADPSRTGDGTGLGLAICKHVVQAHGGSIYAESDGPGRGATFRFTLRTAAAELLTTESVYAEYHVA